MYWDSFSTAGITEIVFKMKKEGRLADVYVRFLKLTVDNVFKILKNLFDFCFEEDDFPKI